MTERPTPEQMLAAAYALDGTNEASNDLYSRWAETYDEDLAAEDYLAPHLCALLLRQWVQDPGLRVLDVGCGTGLAARAVRAVLPQARLVGADLSPEMARVATRTGLYEEVVADVDLNVPLPAALGTPFDAVVCSGTFSLGHVGPGGIAHLVGAVRPGGTVTYSVRREHSLRHDFAGTVADLVAEQRVEVATTVTNGPLVTDGGGDYWTLRVR